MGPGAGGVGAVLALMNLAGMAELLVVGAYADRGWIRFFLIFFPFTSLIGVIRSSHRGRPCCGWGSARWWAASAAGRARHRAGRGPYQSAEYGWIAYCYPPSMRNTMVSRFSARDVACWPW